MLAMGTPMRGATRVTITRELRCLSARGGGGHDAQTNMAPFPRSRSRSQKGSALLMFRDAVAIGSFGSERIYAVIVDLWSPNVRLKGHHIVEQIVLLKRICTLVVCGCM